MNKSSYNLEREQRWMQAVIMHPDGVAGGVASAEAKCHLDVPLERIEEVVCRSRQLTSRERLSIYHNAYFARLLECLRSVFPSLARAVGNEAFDELGVGYLQRYPSHSYTLDALGANFDRYLQETRPDRDEATGLSETWPDFLIELATLEWAVNEVFDGPGNERQPGWTAESVAATIASCWPDVQIKPSPSLKVFSFRFPVNDYYTSLRQAASDEDLPAIPDPSPTWLALTRRDYIVRRHALTPAQFILLSAITSGESVGQAILRAATVEEGSLEEFSTKLQDWFRRWTAAGFFVAMESEPFVA
ncbi:MAG TPA: DNA-binding domain-containing protein [Pirellulales bacterium]|nr:DNA-binding domain-containing protein [Pirellulales bacterium]